MKKPFVKLSCSFSLIVFFAFTTAAAQDLQKCALTSAPRLNGLTLGMSAAEVRAVFGKNPSVKVKTSGDRTFFQNYINKKVPANLSGVRAFYLRFLDGSLYQIEIFYEENSAVPNLETFTANLSAQINLPPEANWQFTQNRALIDCGAFSIAADKTLNPRVELTDTAKLAEAAARRAKKS